jgi:quercetin dioxygenase-like cupin family protein
MNRKTRLYVAVAGLGGILAGIGLLTGYPQQVASAEPAAPVAAEAKVTPLLSKDLKEFPGKEGSMITVEYPPGSVDPVHRHNAHAFVYVLEGSIVMQLKGGKEVTLKPGDTFYEGPDDVHTVGRNASKTEPAKFVVFLVKNKGAPVLIPVK